MSGKVELILAITITMVFTGVSQANIGKNSLKINLIKHDPFPVDTDTDFRPNFATRAST